MSGADTGPRELRFIASDSPRRWHTTAAMVRRSAKTTGTVSPSRYTRAVDRVQLIERLRGLFAEHTAGLVCSYLFGSVARGDDTAHSDLDLAVLFASEPPPTPEEGLGLTLAGVIEGAMGRSVDLVVLNTAPVDLVHRVLRDGVLLLDADPSARIRFEIAARNAYFDLLPTLRRYRRASPGRVRVRRDGDASGRKGGENSTR